MPIAFSRNTNSLASDSAVRARTPIPGLRTVFSPQYIGYPPAVAAKTALAIAIHAPTPKLASPSGNIKYQTATPSKTNTAAANG